MILRSGVALLFLVFQAGHACADEIRVGLSFQDVSIEGLGGVKGKEKGVGLTLEYVGDTPEFLEWAFEPRPYIGGTINLSGDTSFGGTGLLWQTELLDKLQGEIGFGVVIHDGELELPLPGDAMTAEQAILYDRLNAENIEFGSRVLFRTQFALGYDVSDDWSAQIFYEHLSHGKILSSGSNEGLDNIGVRLARRF